MYYNINTRAFNLRMTEEAAIWISMRLIEVKDKPRICERSVLNMFNYKPTVLDGWCKLSNDYDCFELWCTYIPNKEIVFAYKQHFTDDTHTYRSVAGNWDFEVVELSKELLNKLYNLIRKGVLL